MRIRPGSTRATPKTFTASKGQSTSSPPNASARLPTVTPRLGVAGICRPRRKARPVDAANLYGPQLENDLRCRPHPARIGQPEVVVPGCDDVLMPLTASAAAVAVRSDE